MLFGELEQNVAFVFVADIGNLLSDADFVASEIMHDIGNLRVACCRSLRMHHGNGDVFGSLDGSAS